MKTEVFSNESRAARSLAVVGAPSINVPYRISGVEEAAGAVTYKNMGFYQAREVPDGAVIGGSAINTAVSAHRTAGPLVEVSLVTFLGKDRFTPKIVSLLDGEGITNVHTNLDSRIPNDKTNENISPGGVHYFTPKSYLRDRDPNYEELTTTPDCIFLTSINWPWINAYRKTTEYVANENIKLAFSPGPSEIADIQLTQAGLENLQEDHEEYRDVTLGELKSTFFGTLEVSSTLFVSKKDAVSILTSSADYHKSDLIVDNTTEIPELLHELSRLGPQVVSITDGANGYHTLDSDGSVYSLKPFATPSEEPVDTMGATEAYAGTFMSYLLLGTSVPESMKYAAINARSVGHSQKAHEGMLDGFGIETTADFFPDYRARQVNK